MLSLWGIFSAFDSLLFKCSSHPTGQIITKHVPEVQFVKNCSTCRTLRKLNFMPLELYANSLSEITVYFFLFPGIKWGRREADHKSTSCAKVKNDWSFTSTHLHTFMACSGTISISFALLNIILIKLYFHLCFNNCISQAVTLPLNTKREHNVLKLWYVTLLYFLCRTRLFCTRNVCMCASSFSN